MTGKKLVGIGMVGAVCCFVVAGVAYCVAGVVNAAADVIDDVIDGCCPLVDSLVEKIMKDEG